MKLFVLHQSAITLANLTRVLVLLLMAFAWVPVVLAAPVHVNVDADGVVLHGYDPVAYFTAGQPMKGKPDLTATYNDGVYRFATQENLEAFQREPTKYAPQYGGYCALGVAMGRKFDGDPNQWKIVDGKLYVNVNADAAKVWNQDIPGNLEKSENLWPQIKAVPAAELE